MIRRLFILILAITLLPLSSARGGSAFHDAGGQNGQPLLGYDSGEYEESAWLEGRSTISTHDVEVSNTIYTEAGGSSSQHPFEADADGLIPVIVLLAHGAPARAQLLADLGSTARVHRHFTHLLHGLALRLDPAALPVLRVHPATRAVYPDTQVRIALADSVPLVGAPQVWALTDGAGQPVTGLGVRVAIVDSGVDYTHAALGGCFGPGCKVAGGYDFVHDDGDPLDDHGHGTHVAGIVAADGERQGVAPGAELLAYKAIDQNGVGYASDVIAALERAIADGADVINLSLGGAGTPDDPVSLAAQAAVDEGCVVVAAGGNRGPRTGTVDAPSIAPGVISVASADKQDRLADSSSRGPVPGTFALKPDLTAPGVEISSTVPLTGPVSDPSGWLPVSGTSMAAPHVAGGAALLRQLYPEWSPAKIKAVLMNYALDLGTDLFGQGAGRLDLPLAATPDLLAVPGSLSFGLPLLDGTQFLTLTLHNLSTATLTITPTLTLDHVYDGAGLPISPTVPVTYATLAPSVLALPPGGSQAVSVTLDIPLPAADGHYQGWVRLQAQGAPHPASVPLAFTLLSRVILRVLDEGSDEIEGWGHMAVLARVPDADYVISNVPLQLPVTFTVPSGDYYAQAFGRLGLYDHLLIPGETPQVPYAVIQPATVEPHAIQTLTLDLAGARPYWLPATGVAGAPAFINAWAASFRYQNGDAAWLTRLGQSYVRVLSTDLPDEWPAGFLLHLSDTPPGVTFGLALQGVEFSPRYRDFVLRHGPLWPANPTSGVGFPLVGSADQVEFLAWQRPGLDASTPPTFTVPAVGGDVVRYDARTDLPGLFGAPWLGWESGAEGWLYPPTGAQSGLEPIAPGLTYTLVVSGAHQAVYRAGNAPVRIFYQSFYSPDWSQTYPWDDDPAVLFPDEASLQPLSPGQGAFTLGAGPFYPALIFDNQPGTIRVRHPLLAGATGSPVAWAAEPPAYVLTVDGTPLATGTLPEYNWAPPPLRRWPDLAPGNYALTITPTIATKGIEPGIIRAGFTLTGAVGADLDPPQVLDLALPQRFDPAVALTATWTLSDANPITLVAGVRLGGTVWQPLDVEPLGGNRCQARIEPGGALTVSLTYTATDVAGNWLAWRHSPAATALAQVPVTLTFELSPASVPRSRYPVTVRFTGSLLGPGGQPLAESPAWLRLRAGGQFVGYVRDLTGSPGNYSISDIDFSWTFVPAELADAADVLPVSLEFDVGLYAPQVVTRTLDLVPVIHLPLLLKDSAP